MDKIISGIIGSGTVKKGSHVIAGFSGGPDSLCLLHALWTLSEEMKLTIVPVHINHMFRGVTADRERDHAIELCENMSLKCRSFDIDCAKYADELGVSDEEAGRLVRYGMFSRVARSIEAEGVAKDDIAIAVAQNADDQSETVMFRVIRGTGIRGLAGIRPERSDENGYRVIRPILGIERADIEDYIERNGLEPNIDESNKKADYSRNKIRLELLPYISSNINTNVKQNLRRLADIAALDDDYMEKEAGKIFSQVVSARDSGLAIDISGLKDSHPAIINRVIAMAMRSLGEDDIVRYDLVTQTAELVFSDNPSAGIDLPGGFMARRDYENIVIGKPGDDGNTEYAGELKVSVVSMSEFRDKRTDRFAAFDYDEFMKEHPEGAEGIVLRERRAGDSIAIGGHGSKSIQDLMVDDKISRSERDRIPMVASAGEILWIPPHRALASEQQRNKGKYSQNYQFSDKTERVLFLEIVKRL